MTLRAATDADLTFVQSIQDRPENDAFIGTSTREELQEFIASPASHLMVSDDPGGFALLQGPTSYGVLWLQRIAIDVPGGGHGTKMLRHVIDYSFDTLGAHRLWLDVITDNTRARRAYEAAGFVYEGTMRQHWRRRKGDLVDVAVYGLLAGERA